MTVAEIQQCLAQVVCYRLAGFGIWGCTLSRQNDDRFSRQTVLLCFFLKMRILVSNSIYSHNFLSPGHCVLGSQVLCGASIQADGEGSSSLRPGSTRLSLTHALGRSQATIPGYNGLIMAHTL